jgi:hypothetical protein
VTVPQVAVEAVARCEAVATGLAVERRLVVPGRRVPRMVAVPVAVPDARLVMAVMAAIHGSVAVIESSVIAPVPPLDIAVIAGFSARASIGTLGRCDRGQRQQSDGQPHEGDCETRSVFAKRHSGPPLTWSDLFDEHPSGIFIAVPGREKSPENSRKSLRRTPI